MQRLYAELRRRARARLAKGPKNPAQRRRIAVISMLVLPMEFSDTYRDQVLQSRKDRSRRAIFWSRIVGVVLMLTVGVILRSEPGLRADLANAGMDFIATVSGQQDVASTHEAPQINNRQLQDRVKVNRPGQVPADPVTN